MRWRIVWKWWGWSGWSARAAAERVGVSRSVAQLWARLAGMRLQKGKLGGLAELRKRRVKPPRPRAEAPEGPFLDSNGRLDLAGRVLIQIRLREACSYRRIATELGVAASTVSREIAAHTVDGKYRPPMRSGPQSVPGTGRETRSWSQAACCGVRSWPG